jgi:plastocyanin
MKLLRISVLLAAALLLLGAMTACGDDDDDEDGGDNATAAATTPAATDDGNGGADNEAQVEAEDFSFTPDSFTIPAGEEVKIELTNTGQATHTFTVYTDEDFTEAVPGADTGNVPGGEDGEVTATFDAAEYYFRCEIHTQMTGEFEAE